MPFRSEIRTETQVAGTAPEVWAVLTDFADYDEWNPAMRHVEGRAEVGTRLSIAFTLNSGRSMALRPKVLVADPDREFRWLGRLFVPGLFDGEHRFEIHEDESGQVTFVQGERFRGLLVPFLKKLIQVDTAATFATVNAALVARVADRRAETVA
jgi:hypothetical protein